MDDPEYIINFPILSHRGEELLPAGTLLDEKTLFHLRTLPLDRRTFPAGFTGIVKTDIEKILQNPVYKEIFRDKNSRDRVFSMLQRIALPNCGIEVIEYFKEKDFYTYQHMLAVFAISTYLVSLFDSSGVLITASIGSLTHDIGKCSLPVDLLLKTAPLSATERRHIEHHTLAGYALLYYYTDINADPAAAQAARDHHEYIDGSGYPAGRRLNNILTEIVIASDIYDALLSPRPYRKKPFDNRSALEELTSKAENGKISKPVVQALIAGSRKNKPHWSECVLSHQKRGSPPEENNYEIREE